jgi:hypothetical protein
MHFTKVPQWLAWAHPNDEANPMRTTSAAGLGIFMIFAGAVAFVIPMTSLGLILGGSVMIGLSVAADAIGKKH